MCAGLSCSQPDEPRSGDDFAWIRGANYTPSYAANDVVFWRDFDPEVVERELGLARRLGLNVIRVFLQYVVFEHDPELFLARFDTFLDLCDANELLAMPVLFDSCFGMEPSLENSADWVANPGFRRLAEEYRPGLADYLVGVVGRHSTDERIVLWDLMNEPEQTPEYSEAEGRARIEGFVDWVARRVRELDRVHPRTIGTSGRLKGMRGRAHLQEVLGLHSYDGEPEFSILLRDALDLGRELGKPVLLTEFVRPDRGQDFTVAFRALDDVPMGWCFWELVDSRIRFEAGRGLIYTDGSTFDREAVAAVRGVSVSELEKFPLHPRELTAAERDRLLRWGSVPTPPERYAVRSVWVRLFLERLTSGRPLLERPRLRTLSESAEAHYARGELEAAAKDLDRILELFRPRLRAWPD